MRKRPFEAYVLLKTLCYSTEDSQGFKMTPEDETNFRKMIMEEPKNQALRNPNLDYT